MAITKKSARPIPPRGWFGDFIAIVFIVLAVVAAYLIRIVSLSSGVADDMDKITESRRFLDRDIALRSTYTGNALIDKGIGTLVAAFMAGPTGWDKGFQVQMFYFLVSFFSIISIWSVESVRKGHSSLLTSYTSLWALFYQTVGGAIIIPLYYLAYLYESGDTKYWTRSQRPVSLPYAKALLPALVIGYLIPTIVMFLPDPDPGYRTTQFLIFLWQPTPLYVNTLLFVLSRIFSSSSSAEPKNVEIATTRDVPYLITLYKVAFGVTALAHFGAFYVVLTSADPQHDFTHVFLKPYDWGQSGVTKGLHGIFQADYWIIFIASLIWAYLAVWDLKRGGKTKTSLIQTATLIILGSIFVGPAATVAGVWYWRENVMLKDDVYVL